jgi:(p)ppGpp synthase/HD superfamily hydrolase
MVTNKHISEWCIEKHHLTNHYYDTYLPYEFHLRMVNTVAKDFSHLLDNKLDYVSGVEAFNRDDSVTEYDACMNAIWGHDLIEDTRTSYNDINQFMGQEAADIIYAVTNEKGKRRKDRANDKYYEGIRNTKGAIFVKLCDRIANVQYSKLTKSRMFEQYRNENENFLKQLGYGLNKTKFEPMFVTLIELFNN